MIVTLNNCNHINIYSAQSTPLVSVTLGELIQPLMESDSILLQRLKWLVKEHVKDGGIVSKAAVRTFLLARDIE